MVSTELRSAQKSDVAVTQFEIVQQEKPSAREHQFAICATMFSFIIFGLMDGSVGALLPSMQEQYRLSYTKVSLVFFVQILGYGTMGLLSTHVQSHVGRRWGVHLGCVLLMAGLGINFSSPKHFGGIIAGFILLGFAGGVFEAMLNAFLGSFMESATLLGCLHGFYGIGAVVAPIGATQWLTHGKSWNQWYAVLLGVAALVPLIDVVAFRSHTAGEVKAAEKLATDRHYNLQSGSNGSPSSATEVFSGPLKGALTSRFCLIGSAYMFLYLAMEISTAGFIVTYLTSVRRTSEAKAGFANTGFWLGVTLGRFLLMPIASKFGAWFACQVYTALGLCCVVAFWLSPSAVGASVAISLVGFCIGPTFPLILQLATDQLPPKLHVAGIALIASFGSIGGSVFPLVVGILSTAHGPRAIPPVLIALFVSLLLIWLLLPGRPPLRRKKLSRCPESQAAE
jgi:fucose permease